MSGGRGRFAVRREVFADPLFKTEPFTEREAWLWITAEAAWKPRRFAVSTGHSVKAVDLERGQLCHSLRYMQAAWRWPSLKRVRSFLARLEMDTRIATATGTGHTLITVCNYDDFQFGGADEGTATGTETRTRGAQHGHKTKNENKERKAKARDPGFFEWYAVWPKKRSPDDAERAYARVIRSGRITHAELMRRTKTVAAQWVGKDMQFCPYPATWLNKGGFDDGIAEQQPQPVRDPATFSETEWRKRVQLFGASGDWAPSWGPAPGSKGCLVPSAVLAEARAA